MKESAIEKEAFIYNNQRPQEFRNRVTFHDFLVARHGTAYSVPQKDRERMAGSVYPIKIRIDLTQEEEIITDPNDIPTGVLFHVIETNVKE